MNEKLLTWNFEAYSYNSNFVEEALDETFSFVSFRPIFFTEQDRDIVVGRIFLNFALDDRLINQIFDFVRQTLSAHAQNDDRTDEKMQDVHYRVRVKQTLKWNKKMLQSKAQFMVAEWRRKWFDIWVWWADN